MTMASGLRHAGMAVDVVFDGHDAIDHLWPSGDYGYALMVTLARGFQDACACRWERLTADPSAEPRPKPWWLRVAPRAATCAALVAAAVLIPPALGHILSPAAGRTLTVALLVTALTALVTPTQALSAAASEVNSLVKPLGSANSRRRRHGPRLTPSRTSRSRKSTGYPRSCSLWR